MPFLVDEKFVEAFRRLQRKVHNLRVVGGNVSHTPDAITIFVRTPQERQSPQNGSDSTVHVKITGNASGGGKYTGKIFTPSATVPTASGNAAESDFGDLPTADDALVINAAEVGASSHDLSISGWISYVYEGTVRGKTDDGKKIVRIDGKPWKNCST